MFFLAKEMELQRCMLKFTLPKRSTTWGMTGGSQIKTFDTDCGKIGIMICYDVEFPELSD
jgi:predicted amidohydrolase